jgi:hypothetical protein
MAPLRILVRRLARLASAIRLASRAARCLARLSLGMAANHTSAGADLFECPFNERLGRLPILAADPKGSGSGLRSQVSGGERLPLFGGPAPGRTGAGPYGDGAGHVGPAGGRRGGA